MAWSAAFRARVIALVVGIGLLAGMAISWRTWTFARSVPAVPWIEGVPTPGAPWDWLLLGAFACSVVGWMIAWRSRLIIGLSLLLALVIAVQDMLRAQPWFYQYVLMMGLVLVHAARARGDSLRQERAGAGLLRDVVWMCAAIYFYSGLHKVSTAFVDEIFPHLARVPIDWLGLSKSQAHAAGWAIGPTEAVFGLLLLWRRTRLIGVVFATLMHVSILLSLVTMGEQSNVVVWPWNLVMVLLLWLCWRPQPRATNAPASVPEPSGAWQATSPTAPAPRWAGALHLLLRGLIVVAPALGLARLWPMYLSWGMYAGGDIYLVIGMSDEAFARAPEWARAHPKPVEGERIKHACVLNEWVAMETQVRAFPEPRYAWGLMRRALREFPSLAGVVVMEIPEAPRFAPRGKQINREAVDVAAPLP